MVEDSPNTERPAGGPADSSSLPTAGVPGSASPAHPTDGVPIPAHGFDDLDDQVRELATIPAVEIISRAAVLLMSAAAEKLGLAPGEEPEIDLDEARRLISALAGLLSTSLEYFGPHRQPMRDGLRALQSAFREASAYPDEPGQGPGEALLR